MPARSEAPNDPRPYIRVALDLPMHPKLAAIEDNFHACGWAYVCSLCYCGQSMTDGHFPLRAVLRMADVTRDDVMALVEQGLWHLSDHGCPDCEQPKPGHAVIHDYLKHQRSANEVHDLTAKRRESGRKGAQARWAAPKQPEKPEEQEPGMASAMASAIPSAKASAQQELWQNDGKPMAEERRGEEIQTPPPEGGAKAPRRSRKAPADEDPDEAQRAQTAKDVVAAFIDGARERDRTVTDDVIGQVGAAAKRILNGRSKVTAPQLIAAAKAMGRAGKKDLNQQLLSGSGNDYQGRRSDLPQNFLEDSRAPGRNYKERL